jgi:hypothetical protein
MFAGVLLNTPIEARSLIRAVSVVVGGHLVYGETGLTEPVLVRGTLTSSVGELKAVAATMTYGFGSFELPFVVGNTATGQPAVIEPGDWILLGYDADSQRALRVPRLEAQPDAAADKVSGYATPGEVVTVYAFEPAGVGRPRSARRSEVCDAGGRFVADFATDLDLVPGSSGQVLYATPEATFVVEWRLHRFELEVGSSHLSVEAPAGTHGSVSLESAGALKSRVDGYAWRDRLELWLHDQEWDLAVIGPGDRLTIQLGQQRWVYDVPPMTALVDDQTDSVRGTASANRVLTVTAVASSVRVTADASGAWQADFQGLEDLHADSVVVVAPTQRPTDEFMTHLRAGVPSVVGVGLGQAWVRGYGQAGEVVQLELTSGAGRLRAEGRVGADGSYLIGLYEEGGNLAEMAPGDQLVVHLKRSGFATQLAVAPLAVDVDMSADVVFGQAGPGQMVVVSAADTVLEALAGDDGTFRADFSSHVDIGPSTSVQVKQYYQSGAWAGLRFFPFRVSVQSYANRAVLEAPPDTRAVATVWTSDGALLATDSCNIVLASCQAIFDSSDGRPLVLLPGYRVHVEELAAGPPQEFAVVPVESMSVVIDPIAGDVPGEAPVGSRDLYVEFSRMWGDEGVPPPGRTHSFGAGVFDYEIDPTWWSLLTPGLVADVYYTNPDGHRVFARGALAEVRAYPGEARIDGLARPMSDVRASVTRGGSEVATADSSADAYGVFSLVPRQQDGAVLLARGDQVSSMVDGRMRSLEVAPIAAVIDPSTMIISGHAGTGARVRIDYLLRPRPADSRPAVHAVHVETDAGGSFQAGPPGVPMSEVQAIWVAVDNELGDEARVPVGNISASIYLPAIERVAVQPAAGSGAVSGRHFLPPRRG